MAPGAKPEASASSSHLSGLLITESWSLGKEGSKVVNNKGFPFFDVPCIDRLLRKNNTATEKKNQKRNNTMSCYSVEGHSSKYVMWDFKITFTFFLIMKVMHISCRKIRKYSYIRIKSKMKFPVILPLWLHS